MNKNSKLPTLGQPVFIISENPLEDKVQIAGERGYLNSLTYFAADAILVKKLEYDENYPGNLDRVIINKGMNAEGDSSKSLELRMDLGKEQNPNSAATIFVDEVEAQLVAKKLNENQKKQCKKLLDIATKAYNEYDAIIALCSTR